MKTTFALLALLFFSLTPQAFADGETTGHFMTPYDSIVAIKTASQTILRKDIEAVTFSPGARVLGHLESFRAYGQYHLREDVKAVILKD
jgi:hypothetical protein